MTDTIKHGSQECHPSALLPDHRHFGNMVQAGEPFTINPTEEPRAAKTVAFGLFPFPCTSLGLSVRFLQHPV